MARHLRIAATVALFVLQGCGVDRETAASDAGSTAAGDQAGSEGDAALPPPILGMSLIPGGPFTMGCDEGPDPDCEPDELPQREVWVGTFYIDTRETTNDLFAQFVAAHGNDCEGEVCVNYDDPDAEILESAGSWKAKAGRESYPAVEVTWYGARAYCESVSKRLCTEAEWEKAARGGCELYSDCQSETPIYPWGNDAPTCDLVVGLGCGIGTTQSVGSKPAGKSPYGVDDLAGNVWEWVSDFYAADYYKVGPKKAPKGPDEGDRRVVRGGNHESTAGLRASNRGDFGLPYSTAYGLGFRCCRTP